MICRTLLIILNLVLCSCDEAKTFSVFDKIKTGFKMAGNFFSTDHASKVANLVSSALGKTQAKEGAGGKPSNNIFSGFLRLFGIDSKKIGVIAINAIIIVAQLISSSISLTPPSQLVQSRDISEESPMDWMLGNSAVSDLLSDTKDQKLPDRVIEYVTEKSMDEESGCMQLLICKTTPFIEGMQRAISSTANGGYMKKQDIPFRYFPTVDEVADNGDRCEKKYNYCRIPL
ncbi:hypothetical protein JTB14_001212 [Gonioctena quinquepunctata]|nr:hypothetical protein JTB14_001212 [Gonioctena quinquepunctata]